MIQIFKKNSQGKEENTKPHAAADTILEAMVDGVGVIDVMGNIVQGNSALARMFGYKKMDEIIGKNLTTVVQKDEIPKIKKTIKEALKTGVVKGVRFTAITKAGEKFTVGLNGVVLKDLQGNFVGIINVLEDIREYQKYAAERLNAITPILQKVALGDFSENIEIPEKEDEFTEFSVALNLAINDSKEAMGKNMELVKALKKEKASLEQKVKERTAQINASNQQLKASNQQIEAANQQLAAAQKQLQDKIMNLERFNKITMCRELRILELKEEIAKLKGAKQEKKKTTKQ